MHPKDRSCVLGQMPLARTAKCSELRLLIMKDISRICRLGNVAFTKWSVVPEDESMREQIANSPVSTEDADDAEPRRGPGSAT